MPSVIALGNLANEMIKGFGAYPEYDFYRIATNIKNGKNAYKLESQPSAEEYEKNTPDLKKFLTKAQSDVIFVCTGAEAESACSLRILESIRDRNVTILFLQKDLDLVSPIEEMQNKVCSQVLQNYTRSDLFDNMILVDMNMVDGILGDIPVSEYLQRQSELITSTYHMIQVFRHSNPVMGNMLPSEKPNKISTLGVTNIDEKDDKWLFSLDKAFEIYYLYAVNENVLNSDKRLLKKIKSQVKNRSQENTKVMFGIYPTDYENNFVYCLANTKFIQGEENT